MMDTFRDGPDDDLDDDDIDREVDAFRRGMARWAYVKAVVTVETGEYL